MSNGGSQDTNNDEEWTKSAVTLRGAAVGAINHRYMHKTPAQYTMYLLHEYNNYSLMSNTCKLVCIIYW